MTTHFDPAEVLNSNLELNKMSIQTGMQKLNRKSEASSKSTFHLYKGLNLNGTLKLVETEWLPCEITEAFKAYPEVPKEVVQYFRIRALAISLTHGDVADYRKELIEQLSSTDGNWLELFDPKWPGGVIEEHHIRPVLWMALYHEYKKITKEPVFAFRNVKQHAEEVERFYDQFVKDQMLDATTAIQITDREVLKIAREMIETGTCTSYTKSFRKKPSGIVFS